jgi:MerR family transcriptional regulator, copper efflux regulator
MNIGQAAKASGVSTKMIRYYERIGLIRRASRSMSNYREFSTVELRELQFIRRARTLGFTMDEIAKLLSLRRDGGRSSRDVKEIALRHLANLEGKITEMQEMCDALRTLADACAGDERPDCAILLGLGEAVER